MKRYTVRPGRHAFRPRRIFDVRPSKQLLTITGMFTEESIYEIDGEDQWDWNKLAGQTFSLHPMKDTLMVGWRYNPESGMFELTHYIHEKWRTEYGTKIEEIFSVDVGEEFLIEIERASKNTVKYLFSATKHYRIETVLRFRRWKRFRRIIYPWFGGTSAAPKSISVFIEIV